MKILFLANHFNTGGITTYLMTLTRAFIKRRHTIIIATSGGNMAAELESCGARHIVFPFDIKCDVHPRMLLSIPRLVKLLREERIDVIHAQTRVTQMSAALASKPGRIPYVSTCHGFFRPHLARRLMPLWGEKVIAVSAPVRDHLINDLHASVDKIALVPNGIDLARFVPSASGLRQQLRKEWGITDERVAGIIARLSDVKGHQYLIDAMPLVLKKLPSAKCFIFGSGPLEAELKGQVTANRLGNAIIFHPVVNQSARILPLLDVFVMPSIQEGLGLSVLEAAAMGIPSVVSRVGGLPDVVNDGITGLLVPSRDPLALAEAMIALLSDIGRARVMGEHARAFVCKNYSADPMAESTLKVYSDVIRERR